MKIYPAVDVLGGKAVRLLQGDYNKATVFNESPLKAAEEWVKCGSKNLHIVDLDGARYGKSCINDILKEIKSNFNIFVQTGGGVRTLKDVEERLNAGADRVIIGTAAVKNPKLVEEAVKAFGEKIAVGIDAKNGYVAVTGWQEVSQIKAVDLGLNMKSLGVKTVIYTDISKDGMMQGFNAVETSEMINKTGLNIIASGGISSMSDLEGSAQVGSYGAIIGKALYNGALSLKDILKRFEV